MNDARIDGHYCDFACSAGPDIDTDAIHQMESLTALPADPAAATEEILRRRDEIGFSYFVVGADFAETLAPVVSNLTRREGRMLVAESVELGDVVRRE